MAGRRWRLARRLSLLLPLRVVLAAGGGGAAAASWRRVGESVLALRGWRSVGSAA